MTAEQAWDSILALVLGEKLDLYKIDRSHRVTRYDFPYDKMSPENVSKVVLSMKKSGHLDKDLGNRLNAKDFVGGKRPPQIEGEFLLRASKMNQPARDDHFLRMFGQSSREIVNDSSREGSIQTLMLMNVSSVHAFRPTVQAYQKTQRERRVRARRSVSFSQFLFGRPPSPDEQAAIKDALEQGMKKDDLTWALFNSTEFLFVQ